MSTKGDGGPARRAKMLDRAFYKAREQGLAEVAVVDLKTMNVLATQNTGELGANARVALLALEFVALHRHDAVLGFDGKTEELEAS